MNSQEEQKARVLAMFTSEVADLFKDKDMSVESFLIMGKTVHVIYIADDKKAKEDLKETIVKQSFGMAYMHTTIYEMEHNQLNPPVFHKIPVPEFEGGETSGNGWLNGIFSINFHAYTEYEQGKITFTDAVKIIKSTSESDLCTDQEYQEIKKRVLEPAKQFPIDQGYFQWIDLKNKSKGVLFKSMEAATKDWSNATLADVPVDWLPQIGQEYWNYYKPSRTVNGPFIGHPIRNLDQNDWRCFPTKELAQMYVESIRKGE
jgi:hypothetical protein